VAYDLSIAVLADWLPKFDPPVGGNGFTTPYAERLKLILTVEPSETLASVYQRAIDQLQPRVSNDSLSRPDDLLDIIYWVWFYEADDDDGVGERPYERPEDLILVDEDGRARWNLPMSQLQYGDIVRSGQQGLIRGDPLRPYLPLIQPQGGGELQVGWEAAQLAWQILEQLLVARGAVGLGREARDRLLGRLRGRHVTARHSDEWAARGGDPQNMKRTIDRKPWRPSDLRIIMNLPTDADAEELLALFGHTPNSSGQYEISEDAEARLLRLAEDDVFETLATGLDSAPEVIRARLQRILETGERPP
jgi:hypothetical protein